PLLELARKHAHAHQIAAVDALEALGDYRTHAKQPRPLRRPVARAARAVFLPGKYQKRRPFRQITHCCIVDTHLFTARLMDGHSTLDTGTYQVLDPPVGECAARHDLVVTTTRAVTVEVVYLDSPFLEIETGW